MKKYILALLIIIGIASAYSTEQQEILDGIRLSFQLGVAYEQAKQGTNVTGFNDLADKYNAWIRKNFGEDPGLLISKMSGPVDLSRPYLSSNNSTEKGIVHTIDGSGKYGPQYTTNDINLLPNNAIAKYQSSETGQTMGDGYLGGV